MKKQKRLCRASAAVFLAGFIALSWSCASLPYEKLVDKARDTFDESVPEDQLAIFSIQVLNADRLTVHEFAGRRVDWMNTTAAIHFGNFSRNLLNPFAGLSGNDPRRFSTDREGAVYLVPSGEQTIRFSWYGGLSGDEMARNTIRGMITINLEPGKVYMLSPQFNSLADTIRIGIKHEGKWLAFAEIQKAPSNLVYRETERRAWMEWR